MRYFEFTGELYWCGGNDRRIQPTIIDLQTGETYKPVMTKKNKAWTKFVNNSKFINASRLGFHFTCDYREGSWVQGMHKVQVYFDKNEFCNKFAEHLI